MDDDEKTALARAVASYLLKELRWRDVVETAQDMGLSPTAGDVDWVEDVIIAAAEELLADPAKK